jgi:hypothetical protein
MSLSNLADIVGSTRQMKVPDLTPTDSSRFMFDSLKRYIDDRQAKLGPEEQLLVTCALPDGRELVVDSFGYYGYALLRIRCYDQGNTPIDVLLHPTSVCVTSKIVPREKGKPLHRIGFVADVVKEEERIESEKQESRNP